MAMESAKVRSQDEAGGAVFANRRPRLVAPLDAFAVTIAGRRDDNEDAVCAAPELGLFAVADGMGGCEGGEIASALAIEAILGFIRGTAHDAELTWPPYDIDPARTLGENELIAATRLASDRIAARRVGRLHEMGSTVAALLLAGGHAVIAHVGDSRVYRLRDGELAQLTSDHTLMPVLASRIRAARNPWRHVITRALGTDSAEPDVMRAPARHGDVYLVCSDGLTEVLEPAAIAAPLALPAEPACRALVAAAYDAGSRDNISAIVVRCL